MQSKKEQQRSKQQNKSLHLFCEQFAGFLNDAGLDMRIVLKPEIDIPWTKETIKKYIWKPVQKLQLDKDSTTEMNTVDPTKIWETLNRHFSEKFGTYIPAWPSKERQKEEEMANKYQ